MQERLAALNTGWHTFLQVNLCSLLEAASDLLDISTGSELMLVNPCSFRNKPNINDCLLAFAGILQTSIILPFLLPFKHHLLEEAADLGSGLFWNLLWLSGIQCVCFFSTFAFWFSVSPCTLWLVLRGKQVNPGAWDMKSMVHSCEEEMRDLPLLPQKVWETVGLNWALCYAHGSNWSTVILVKIPYPQPKWSCLSDFKKEGGWERRQEILMSSNKPVFTGIMKRLSLF